MTRPIPTIVALVIFSTLAPHAHAQSDAPCSPGGVVGYISFGIVAKTGFPYAATIRQTFEQRLPDGNSIHSFSVIHQARNSTGTTRSEAYLQCVRSDDGRLKIVFQVRVDDPAARTTAAWEENGQRPKEVRMMHSPQPQPPRQLTPEERVAMQERQKSLQQRQSREEFHTEQLGTRNIQGVLAIGSRTTRTIPAGDEGNDQPLVIVSETWQSEDLGITLLYIEDDPRTGKRTYEVEELSQSEPDASLFALPEGYVVKDIPLAQPQ